MSNKETILTNKAIRRYLRITAFAVMGLVIGAFMVWGVGSTPQKVSEVVIELPAESNSTSTAVFASSSIPTSIRIPAVDIEASFEEPLGLQRNGEIEVPELFTTVGWYKYGPTPGEMGPSVILGHVDSYEGPAVFWSLGQLEIGDLIEVDREDGSTITFEVEALERHEQEGFPTAKVYGNLSYPGLRLITCSGSYNRAEDRYSHNLIVFAKMVVPQSE